jgi:hypothetical protein
VAGKVRCFSLICSRGTLGCSSTLHLLVLGQPGGSEGIRECMDLWLACTQTLGTSGVNEVPCPGRMAPRKVKSQPLSLAGGFNRLGPGCPTSTSGGPISNGVAGLLAPWHLVGGYQLGHQARGRCYKYANFPTWTSPLGASFG